MVLPDSMPVRPTTPSSSLEVFPAHETTIDVDVGHRLGTQAFEIEFEVLTSDLREGDGGCVE